MRNPPASALAKGFDGGLTEQVMPGAGVALLAETRGRTRGRGSVIAAVERALPGNVPPRGLRHGKWVETLALLGALGGDCLADLDGRRQSQGVAALTGDQRPAASTARSLLERFLDPATLVGPPTRVRPRIRVARRGETGGPDSVAEYARGPRANTP